MGLSSQAGLILDSTFVAPLIHPHTPAVILKDISQMAPFPGLKPPGATCPFSWNKILLPSEPHKQQLQATCTGASPHPQVPPGPPQPQGASPGLPVPSSGPALLPFPLPERLPLVLGIPQDTAQVSRLQPRQLPLQPAPVTPSSLAYHCWWITCLPSQTQSSLRTGRGLTPFCCALRVWPVVGAK